MVGISEPARRLKQYPHHLSGGMRQRVMIAMALCCEPKLIIADEPTTALDVTIQAQILELMKDLTRRLGVALIVITHNLGIVARYADRVNVMYAGRIIESGTADEIYHNPRHPYTLALLQVGAAHGPAAQGQARSGAGPAARPHAPRRGLLVPAALQFRHRALRRGAQPRAGRRTRPYCGLLADAKSGRKHKAGVMSLAPVTDEHEQRRESERRVAKAADLITVRNLKMHFPVTEGALIPRVVAHVKAIDGISFTIRKGETLGLVGESGCGKTTTGRCILQLEHATDGEIIYDGTNLIGLDRRSMMALRRRIQVIFQDPYSSLNPRMKIGEIIAEPMLVHKTEPDAAARQKRVRYLLEVCGLNPAFADRYPHEMSGGQRQRVGIARALSVQPEFIICDEAISALDVSIQAQIINLLEDLRDEFGLTYLFIAHDLSVVRHLCHRVAVMYLGKIVELADCDELYNNPMHPYTRALLEAVPIPDPEVERKRAHQIVKGEVPSPIDPPSGCVFHPRCQLAVDSCSKETPEFREVRPGHWVACSVI